MEIVQATQLERGAYRKVDGRVVPLVILAYTVAYLARVNIGFAKLQMLGDLHLSESVYGLGAGIFFFGYLLFEIPSNLLLHRIGARLSITRIMIVWGIISACMMFTSSALVFYLLRFLLGVAEAGFFPGIILYLTYWYPSQRRASTTALFMTSIPLSGLIGGPISGWILRGMSGWHGLAGWKWMFLIEAIPSIVMGFVVLFVMKDGIDDAPWLNREEKALLKDRLANDAGASKAVATTKGAFQSPHLWLMTAIYFCMTTLTYGITFWLPTFLKAAGAKSVFNIGLLTAIPYFFAVAGMVLCSRSSDRTRQRRWHIALPTFIAAAALVGVALSGSSLTWTVVLLTISTTGLMSVLPLFWPLPTALLAGTGAAAGIALVNSIGNFSVFFSQPLMGWLTDVTHSTHSSLYFMAIVSVAAGLLTLAVPARLVDK